MAETSEKSLPKTLRELFEKRHGIGIPVYQRAYSWEEKQWLQFWDDLKEQEGKPYHLGLFLFEQDVEKNLVIDGQQRLTTCVLFFAALDKVYKSNGENADSLSLYLSESAFSTVKDDNAYLRQLIQSQQVSNVGFRATTPSQKKLREAFDYFVKEFEKAHKKDGGFSDISRMCGSLENANIGVFDIADKGEASQVFEYQNNRGIEASKFEVIKAYLIHQVYISAADFTRQIEDIEAQITSIYRNFEKLDGHFSEDDLLQCYFRLFDYYNGADDWEIDGIKWYFSVDNENRVTREATCQWAKAFFENFKRLTEAAVHLVDCKSKPHIANLFLIGDKTYWPAVMFAVIIKDKNIDDDKLCSLAKLLEVLWFKFEVSTRKTVEPLSVAAYEYVQGQRSFDSLCWLVLDAIDHGFGNGKWEEFPKIVTDTYLRSDEFFWGRFKCATKYVLWQYENFLRQEAGQEILTKRSLFENYTVEHIHPQNTEHGYVGNLGNLVLLTQSDNSKASDKDFEDKLTVYKKYFDTAQNTGKLFLYRDILSKNSWRKDEVEERFRTIKQFVINYFVDGEEYKAARKCFEDLHEEHVEQVQTVLDTLDQKLVKLGLGYEKKDKSRVWLSKDLGGVTLGCGWDRQFEEDKGCYIWLDKESTNKAEKSRFDTLLGTDQLFPEVYDKWECPTHWLPFKRFPDDMQRFPNAVIELLKALEKAAKDVLG